jgi:hypothetical protein
MEMNTAKELMRYGLSPFAATLLLVFSVNLVAAPTAAAQSTPITGDHITGDGSVAGWWGVNHALGEAPEADIHVQGNLPKIRLQDTTGPGLDDWTFGAAGSSFSIVDNFTGTSPFRLSQGLGGNALVISPTGAPGNVGIGTQFVGAPLHVFRNNGTAQILVQEVTPITQPRNLFELVNNGPVGFNMFNTNTNQRWRFAAQVDGFRINIADAGDAGPEMIVFADGAVQMGKNQTQQFFLDTSGNVTIQGTLNALSDVKAKANIEAVDGPALLARVATLPIATWSYKEESTRHVGPMAQDFHAAFGLGVDDKHIAPGDVASVALVGVKELHRSVQALRKEVQVRDERIAAQDVKLAEREVELAALKQRLTALEKMISRAMAQKISQRAQR